MYADTDDHLRNLLCILDMFIRGDLKDVLLTEFLPRVKLVLKTHLGILQGIHTRVGDLKDSLVAEFMRRVKLGLKTHLSEKNKISAPNVSAIVCIWNIALNEDRSCRRPVSDTDSYVQMSRWFCVVVAGGHGLNLTGKRDLYPIWILDISQLSSE